MKIQSISHVGSISQAFCKDKQQLDTWISQNAFSIENCAIGDDSVISQLLSKYKALLTRNSDMIKLREEINKQMDNMSIHEMCSVPAATEIREQLNLITTRQVSLTNHNSAFHKLVVFVGAKRYFHQR